MAAVQRGLVDVGQDDRGAGFGERAGGGQTHAGAGAGDQGDLAGEVVGRVHRDLSVLAGQALSWARELDRSRKASACSCRVFAFCSASSRIGGQGDEAARRLLQAGDGEQGLGELGGVAFLLAVHVLVPLHPLGVPVGVVRRSTGWRSWRTPASAGRCGRSRG